MQKVVNVIAVSAGVVSLAVVGSGLYVYLQRDKLVDSIKSQVLKSVTESLPGLVDSKLPGTTGGALPGVKAIPGVPKGLGLPGF